MKIAIFTNHITGGWYPRDKFLGGSEDSICELSYEFSRKGHQVVLFHTQSKGQEFTHQGVSFKNRQEIISENSIDILLLFKDNSILLDKSIDQFIEQKNVKKIIYLSSEVERPFDISKIDYFVCLTEFHLSRMPWIGVDKSVIIPWALSSRFFNLEKKDKKKETVLYSSSPDRGLLNLLNDWEQIYSNNNNLSLRITYGFDLMKKLSVNKQASNQTESLFIEKIKSLKDKNVEFLGAVSEEEMIDLYNESEFWVLPLQNPESELFCLNAIKARLFNCKRVINYIGALKETSSDYIDYKDFILGKHKVTRRESLVDVCDFNIVYNNFWKEILE